MSIYNKTFIMILFITMTSVFAFQCPTIKECDCTPRENDTDTLWDANIKCTINNNSVFEINIQEKIQSITVKCINSSDLSDLNLHNILGTYTEIKFDYCNLPNNIKLSDIIRNLGDQLTEKYIEELTFTFAKNLTLKKHHLDDFENLKTLSIENNNIFYMDKDLLANMNKLRYLKLYKNNLKHLDVEFFQYAHKLRSLLVIGNLKSIKPGTFDKLKDLQYLILENNNLTELYFGIFDKLIVLKELDISSNNLFSLPKDIFAKLKNLIEISLGNNSFIDLPKDLLRNNTKIEMVDIRHNRNNLTLLGGFFSNLTNLVDVYLNNNGLVTLPEDLFWGSFSIRTISLNNNYLKFLHVNIFKNLTELNTLRLNSNNLEVLPDNVFQSTNRLQILDLSNNRITCISSQLLYGLWFLEKLNMERNHLNILQNSFSSLSRVKIIKLSHNNLTLQTENPLRSHFYSCRELEELYLANNSISEIVHDWINYPHLHTLDLSYNNISIIKATDLLLFFSQYVIVNLSHNKIQHIHFDNVEIMQESNTEEISEIDYMDHTFEKILLEHNPLSCNCDFLYNLLRYNKRNIIYNNYRHKIYLDIELKNLICQNPKEMEKVRISDLNAINLTCRIKNTDYINVCPEKCDCFLKPYDKTFIFDCSNRNLTNMPNNIKEPDIFSIRAFTKLIDPISKFQLNFSHNVLMHMPNLRTMELWNVSVKELILSHNNISEISFNGLSDTIKILKLHNNNLSRIHPNVLKFLKNSINLTHLTLHENPWECDCDAAELLHFTQTRYQILPEVSKMMCYKEKKFISEMTFNEFCPFDTTMIFSSNAAIATAITTAIAFVGLIFEEELDKDKSYDAFVSYSHKDSDFVENELVPKLESGPTPFKLCLHYRDWLAGEFIQDNIARSVENSRRTIVVLSPNFLESVWGRVEFRTAHCQALNEGRMRVILILYADVELTDNLNPELKAYISMNTYIQWGDRWFWDKLRYALPHSSRQSTLPA